MESLTFLYKWCISTANISRVYRLIMLVVIISNCLLLDCLGSPGIIRVQRLKPGHIIKVDDNSLNDWNDSLIVMKIKPEDAKNLQWTKIRGRPPKPLSSDDIFIKVFMARDEQYWFVAMEARDDKLLTGPSGYPYSGDCLEIFFAGKELDSETDFHYHVEASESSNQAAFFQLEIPAGVITGDYFPEWRTDTRIRKNAIDSGFMASIWKTASGWNAEMKIPLHLFEQEVCSRIKHREVLKINIDYLDYDSRTARQNNADDWGFLPDNVFCLDAAEENVHTPKYMRSIIFE